jgi:arylsulfatase A-like enzyme
MHSTPRSGFVLLGSLLLLALSPPVILAECAPSPRSACRRSERGRLVLKSDGDPRERRLFWRWQNGEATPRADFGDPRSTAEFELCLYGGAAQSSLYGENVQPGPRHWRATPLGYRYQSARSGTGIDTLVLRSGAAGAAGVTVLGRLRLRGATASIPLPVTVQMGRRGGGACWESVYGADNRPRNDEGVFLAAHRGLPRPNVIVINTDDQWAGSIGYMPTVVRELAEKGVTFANAFAPNPVCLSSRASFLTGNHSHTHGLLGNGTPAGAALHFIGPDRETIAVWLQSTGYRTAMFGKYLNGYASHCGESICPVPPGWDEWYAFLDDGYHDYRLTENGRIVPYGSDPEAYSTDVLRDRALAFLDAHPGEPLFVYFAPFAPHAGSRDDGYLPIPAPRHAQLLLGLVRPWRPPSYMETDVSDKPAWIRARPAMITGLLASYWDQYQRLALESLLAVDEAIAALLAKLEEQGRVTDTIVMFTSDNGYSRGEHRLFGKLCPYDECARVPLLIRYPRVLRDRPATIRRLAATIDLAPTIAEWARVPAERMPPLDGLSLARLAQGDDAGWRDAILLEQWEGTRYGGVRTAEWKYVAHKTGERELYDLVNDPLELASVTRRYPAIAAQLESRIVDLGGSIP